MTRSSRPVVDPVVERVVRHFAEEWRTLKAWGRALEEVHFVVKPYVRGKLGYASYCTGEVEIRVRPGDVADALETVLHELAHHATGGGARAGVHHGDKWKGKLFSAICEVTDITGADDHVGVGWTMLQLDAWARGRLAKWWQERHAFAFSLLKKAKATS